MPDESIRSNEYIKLASEIEKCQDSSVRVVLGSLGIVGLLISAKIEDYDAFSVGVGVEVVLIASLIYLIGAARKIFFLTAYLSVVHEKSQGWHRCLAKLTDKSTKTEGPGFWYETQIIAILYFISGAGTIVVLQLKAPSIEFLSLRFHSLALLSVGQLILSFALYRVPLLLQAFKKQIENTIAQIENEEKIAREKEEMRKKQKPPEKNDEDS